MIDHDHDHLFPSAPWPYYTHWLKETFYLLFTIGIIITALILGLFAPFLFAEVVVSAIRGKSS